MAKILNSIIWAHVFVAQQKGLFSKKNFAAHGLILSDIKSGEGQSSAGAFSSWLAELWKQGDDESGGFLSQPIKSGSFAMGCHAAISAGNLRRALIRSGRFYNLISPDLSLELFEHGEEAHFVIQFTDDQPFDRTVYYDTMLVLWLRLASWLIDQPIIPQRIHLPCSLPIYSDEYHAMYGCTVYSNQKDCRVIFDKSYIEKRIVKSPAQLTDFLSQAPAFLLVGYKAEDSSSHRVTQFFNQHEQIESLDLTNVSKALAIAPSTLRRQLKENGTSFQILKDQWRRNYSVNLLKQSELTLQEIAEKLGFTEASAFHRAFKRWTGHKPGEIRGKH